MRGIPGRSRWAVAAVTLLMVAGVVPAASAAGTDSTVYLAGSGGVGYADASDSNDCSQYETPCATLDGALAQTAAGGEIEVSGELQLTQAALLNENVTIEQNQIPGSARAILYATPGHDDDGLLVVDGAYQVQITSMTFDQGERWAITAE